MFTKTVDSVLSSLTKILSDLKEVDAKKSQEFHTHTAIADAALAESNRARNVSKKLEELLK
jgi:hypothetical protein